MFSRNRLSVISNTSPGDGDLVGPPPVPGSAGNNRANRTLIVIRLADQGMWSAGLFAFNIIGGFTMPVAEYAAMSIATALGFIAVAACRAWGVYSFVILAGRSGKSPASAVDRRSSWAGCFVFGSIAAIVAGVWVWGRVGTQFGILCLLLALAVSLSDLPRQLLMGGGNHTRTIPLSAVYAVAGAAAAIIGVVVGIRGPVLVATWVATLVVITVLGAVLDRGSPGTRWPRRERLPIAWRATAEALYLAAGSQAGLLLVYTIHDPSATTGLRFAYSLIFAPAFVIIQGLQLVVFTKAAQAVTDSMAKVIRIVTAWVGAQALLLLGLGLVSGAGLYFLVDAPGPRAALPFIVPVGVAMFAGQVVEGALLACRFYIAPETVHRLRLGSVLGDIAVQAIAVVLFGPVGLAVALTGSGIVRIVGAAALVRFLRRRRSVGGHAIAV